MSRFESSGQAADLFALAVYAGWSISCEHGVGLVTCGTVSVSRDRAARGHQGGVRPKGLLNSGQS
jgi:hypothetical protein